MKVILTTFATAVVSLTATISPSLGASQSLVADLTLPRDNTLILAQSVEFIRNEITRYYRDFLGREPDAAGLNHHVRKVQNGRSLVQVRRDIFDSPEGRRIATLIQSESFGGRVRQTYLEVLRREPDAAGLAYNVRQLDLGMSLAQVRKSLENSSEGRKLRINAVYQEIWGKEPDETTLSLYSDRMARDGWTIEEVRKDIIAKRQAPTSTPTPTPVLDPVARGLPALPNSGSVNTNAYYVIIPQSSGGDLNQISSRIEGMGVPRANVLIRQTPRGAHVAVGPYRDRKLANEWNRFLRGKGFDARLYYGR